MFKPCGRVIAAFVLWTALANVMSAQGTRATITGSSRIHWGGYPRGRVSLRSLATSAVVKATTGQDGFVHVPRCCGGWIRPHGCGKGFREYIQRGISVNLDQQVRIDVSLTLGATAETIEVSANASPLNFDSAVQKGTIQPDSLEKLPLILGGHTRSAVAFARLLPGVTTGGDDDKLNFIRASTAARTRRTKRSSMASPSVDGSLGQNGIELAVTGHPMSPEAIQEITLLTSNYDAQYGYTSSSC